MRILKKVIIYCLGLFFLAVGVTFSIKSRLGISPVNSIPYIISLITGIEQGHVIIVIFSIFILIQIILLRRNFKARNLLQIIFSTVFGYFVTFSNFIFSFPSPEHYVIRLLLLMVSMTLISIGIILYLRANILPMPPEGLMLAIQVVTKKEFHKVKTVVDTCLVLTATALALIFLGGFVGVREGTIIAAIFIGKIMGLIEKIFKKQIDALVRFMS